MRSTRFLGPLAALACALTAVYLGIHARDEDHLRTANRLALRGDLTGSIAVARSIGRPPTTSSAQRVVGEAELLRGRPALAVAPFTKSLQRAPNDWTVRRDLAVALLAIGQRHAAQQQMSRALELNPRLMLPPGFVR